MCSGRVRLPGFEVLSLQAVRYLRQLKSYETRERATRFNQEFMLVVFPEGGLRMILRYKLSTPDAAKMHVMHVQWLCQMVQNLCSKHGPHLDAHI